jgi:hypothetical protein
MRRALRYGPCLPPCALLYGHGASRYDSTGAAACPYVFAPQGTAKYSSGHLCGAAAQCWQVLSSKWPYGRRRCAHARICLWRLKILTVVVLASASSARSASSVHHRVTAPLRLRPLDAAGLSVVTGRSHLSAVRICARRRVQLPGRHGKLPRILFRSAVTPSFLAPNFRAKINVCHVSSSRIFWKFRLTAQWLPASFEDVYHPDVRWCSDSQTGVH